MAFLPLREQHSPLGGLNAILQEVDLWGGHREEQLSVGKKEPGEGAKTAPYYCTAFTDAAEGFEAPLTLVLS